MEPKNDSELRSLLEEWQAPAAPASLEERVMSARRGWWHVLLHGYIRVPMPVAYCFLILMALGAWRVASSKAECSASNLVSPPVVSAPQLAACPVNTRC
jgi:hypothetical protein